MRIRIWPYRQGSLSARALAARLGGKVLRREGSLFVPQSGDVVINWGDISPPDFVTMNKEVRTASNKKLFFQKMREVGLEQIIPPFWLSSNDIPSDAYPVVCRTVLAGHSGDGIVIAVDPSQLVDAPLYVKYIKKMEEYRVHCSRDQIIAVQRKARRLDAPDGNIDWQVRNHSNGFVFVRGGEAPHDNVTAGATVALGAVGLDFGAVDVIWNAHSSRAYVLEINTAPGLEGQTIADYGNYFLRCDGEQSDGSEEAGPTAIPGGISPVAE